MIEVTISNYDVLRELEAFSSRVPFGEAVNLALASLLTARGIRYKQKLFGLKPPVPEPCSEWWRCPERNALIIRQWAAP